MDLEAAAEVGSEPIDLICGAELRQSRMSFRNLLIDLRKFCGRKSPPYPLRVRARETHTQRFVGTDGGQS